MLCAPGGFGCPARRDTHSSSLSTAELCRGVLSLPGLLPSPAAPRSLICSWDSKPSWRSRPSQLESPLQGAVASSLPSLLEDGPGRVSSPATSAALGQQGQPPIHPGLCPAQGITPGAPGTELRRCRVWTARPGAHWLLSPCRPPSWTSLPHWAWDARSHSFPWQGLCPPVGPGARPGSSARYRGFQAEKRWVCSPTHQNSK